MARSCKLYVGDTYRGYVHTFPLSRGGWSAAHEAAIKLTKDYRGRLATVDLKCTGGTIPIYQCSTGSNGYASCAIERVGAPSAEGVSIAGARRRRRRR